MTRPSRSPWPAPAPSASSTSTRIKNIDGVEVVSLISRDLDKTQEVADKYGIPHVTTDLADSLALKEVDAVILCTPTQMHAAQALACLKAGKHVQVEIPLADSLADAEAVVAAAEADRPGRHVRPHPPLQPQPPVGAPAGSSPASSTSSRWTCRPTSSAAPT